MFEHIAKQPVFVLAIVAIIAAIFGRYIRARLPRFGYLLNVAGYIGIAFAFMVTITQLQRSVRYTEDDCKESVGAPKGSAITKGFRCYFYQERMSEPPTNRVQSTS
jgi:hypothetical protein